MPVCDYQLEAEGLVDVTARACELLGSQLSAGGTLPIAVEEGRRLRPPDAPWAPLQEQVRHLITCPSAACLQRCCSALQIALGYRVHHYSY